MRRAARPRQYFWAGISPARRSSTAPKTVTRRLATRSRQGCDGGTLIPRFPGLEVDSGYQGYAAGAAPTSSAVHLPAVSCSPARATGVIAILVAEARFELATSTV